MGANYPNSPLLCCCLSPYLGFLTGMICHPHLFTNIGALHSHTAGTAAPFSLHYGNLHTSPAFILALGDHIRVRFVRVECWVCGPDTSKWRGANWLKWIDQNRTRKGHFLWVFCPTLLIEKLNTKSSCNVSLVLLSIKFIYTIYSASFSLHRYWVAMRGKMAEAKYMSLSKMWVIHF